MPIQIALGLEQLHDLTVMRDLGANTISAIKNKLSSITPPPIKTNDLQQALKEVLEGRPSEANIVLRVLITLGTLCRERELSSSELLEGIRYSISISETPWTDEELSRWKKVETQLADLFLLPSVRSVVKTLDLSYDYTNLFQSAKVITDIRPVFNEAATDFEGVVITYTLRLFFDSLGGSKSLSIALDKQDVERLLVVCERALEKANTARSVMQKGKLNTVIVGEEYE